MAESSSANANLLSSILNLFSVPSYNPYNPLRFVPIATHQKTATPTPLPKARQCSFDVLPDEILSEIFLQTVLYGIREAYFGRLVDFDGGRAPWNLAAVCRKWRRVSLSNAKLWSYIVIGWHHCPSSVGRDGIHRASLVHTPGSHHCPSGIGRDGNDGASVVRTYLQLERSRSFLLYIDASDYCKCPCAVSMLRAVGKECYRWKWACFTDCERAVDTICDILPSSPKASQLETLTWQSHSDEEFMCPLTELTSLRSVTFIDFTQISTSYYDFPWNQLTHLVFEAFAGSLDSLFDALSQCTALIDLKLGTMICDSNFVEELCFIERHEEDSIVLPHLTSFDLTDAENAPPYMLPYLRAPKLRKFTYDQDDIPSDSVLEFILRSSCPLTTFKLYKEYGKSIDLSMLKSMPEIETLSIYDRRCYSSEKEDAGIYTGNESLRRLIAHSSSALCPRLQHLELHDIGFDPMLLVQVVDSRADADDSSVIPLQSVTVYLMSVTKKRSRIDFYKKVLGGCLHKHTLNGLQVHLEGRLSSS